MFIFKGQTPLMLAARDGHLDIVEFLLNNGNDIKDMDDNGKFLILYLIVKRQFIYLFCKNITTTYRQNI